MPPCRRWPPSRAAWCCWKRRTASKPWRALWPCWASAASPSAASLTKQFEEIATVAASALPEWFSAGRDRTRGEFALVLHPVAVSGDDGAEAERVLRLLLAELPLKGAVKLAAEITRRAAQ